MRGVVWAPLGSDGEAVRDLARIRETGFTAVRVDGLPSAAVLRAADSLALRVFVDLPVDYVLAADLRGRLPVLRRALDTLAAHARRHPSLGAVGLARRADTSDPATCAAIGDLARHARARGLTSYYVTAFIETDRCDGVVDLVLLTGRDLSRPESRIARWQRTHGTPAGLGGVGYWVDGRARGTRAANSPEAQARAFETLFTRLDTLAAPLFVYRWRDGTEGASDDPLGRPYGLVASDGQARPALAVARGFLTGTLTAFAFEPGESARGGLGSLLALFWLAVLIAGIVHAAEPRVRTLLLRYVRAHSFYRDSLRDARDTLAVSTFCLMLAFVLATGVAAAALVEVLRPLPSFEALVTFLPGGAARVLAALAARPWLLAVFVGLIDLLAMALWTLLFQFASRRRYVLSVWQALGFVVWPRWTALPIAAAALVTATLPPLLAPRVAVVVAVLLVLSIAWGGVRGLLDLKIVARPTLGRFALAIALHPVSVVALYLALRAATLGPRLAFLWRLATQS